MSSLQRHRLLTSRPLPREENEISQEEALVQLYWPELHEAPCCQESNQHDGTGLRASIPSLRVLQVQSHSPCEVLWWQFSIYTLPESRQTPRKATFKAELGLGTRQWQREGQPVVRLVLLDVQNH